MNSAARVLQISKFSISQEIVLVRNNGSVREIALSNSTFRKNHISLEVMVFGEIM